MSVHGGGEDELRQIDALNRLDRAGEPEVPGESPLLRDAIVLEVGRALVDAGSVEQVLRAVGKLSSPELPLDGQAVFGRRDRSLDVLGQQGYDAWFEGALRMPVETGYPAAQVIRTGQAVYLPSPEDYRESFPETWALADGAGRRSWAFLPLVSAGRTIGAWMASFRAERAFPADERALLGAIAKSVALALERTRTGQAELALSLGLRRSMGSAATERPGLTVASRYVPTGGGLMVGGDWYDVIDLPGGRLGLVIGDVEGHDVVAAGLMSRLRTAIHAYAAEGHGPDAVLSRTSRFLRALDDDRYATCIYIEADPATGTLALSRAGHPHPVLRLPDGTCLIKHVEGGLPLGLMDDEDDYPVTTIELEPDEVMLLCTDGLIETGGHDMYTGWVRVRDALSPDGAGDLEGMADRLLRAVQGPTARTDHGALPQRNEDDIAFLLLRRDAGGGRTRKPERRLVLTIEQDQAEGLAEARAELRFLLHDWQADQVDSAVLLCSELLANVLVHTDQTATLVARLEGEPGQRRLHVEVSDRGDELPHQRAPGELASSGRGLMLLELLADRWGVRPRPVGKTVWFELDEASAG